MLNKPHRHHRGFRFGLAVLFTLAMIVTSHAKTIEDVIPADSFLYLKIQHLAACREAVENSENWKEAAEFIAATPNWQPMNQVLQMLPMFTGTDVSGLLDIFLGDQLALTVSAGAEGLLIALVLQNAGKTPAAEQTLTMLTQTLSSMGNEVNVEEHTYQDITYHTVAVSGQQFTYGSLDSDLFLVGLTPASFKKIVDVYHAEQASIATNAAYRSVVEKAGAREVFAFVDVTVGSPYLQLLLPPIVSRELVAFHTVGYTLDLLRPGGGHRLYGQLNTDGKETLIPRLQAAKAMQTTRGLSGTEELFLALSPSSTSLLWQALLGGQAAASEVYNFLFPPTAALQAALAGELTVAVNISSLAPHFSELFRVKRNVKAGAIESVSVDFPEINVGFIFTPEAPEKWQAVFNRFLEKITVHSREQRDYQGSRFTAVSLPGTLYYGSVNLHHRDFFLLACSEQQFQTMVANLLGETEGDLQERLAAFGVPTAGHLHLNLGTFLGLITGEKQRTEEIGALLATLVVKAESAWVDIAHAQDETASEAMAKLAPFLFLTFTMNEASSQ